METAHRSLQWNTVFFLKFNLNLLSSNLFLLPPSFDGSVVAFDTNTWGMLRHWKRRLTTSLAHKPNLDVQGVELYVNHLSAVCTSNTIDI